MSIVLTPLKKRNNAIRVITITYMKFGAVGAVHVVRTYDDMRARLLDYKVKFSRPKFLKLCKELKDGKPVKTIDNPEANFLTIQEHEI